MRVETLTDPRSLRANGVDCPDRKCNSATVTAISAVAADDYVVPRAGAFISKAAGAKREYCFRVDFVGHKSFKDVVVIRYPREDVAVAGVFLRTTPTTESFTLEFRFNSCN